MPRDLVVGNGTLLVNLDRNMNIRDLYYPHVGLHNHVNGCRNRVGIWVGGQFSWMGETWSVRMGYRPGTLTTDAHASNGRLGIGLKFNDTVHPELNLFLRQVSVENLHGEGREVRLFLGHDFRIYESDIGDTVFFHPFTGALVHFKRDCYILINGSADGEGIYQYATGIKEFGGAEGTWRDAEDGSLSMHPIEQGSVDSTVSFRMQIPGGGSAELDYWIAVGRSLDEVAALNAKVRETSPKALLAESESHWKSWLSAVGSGGSEAAGGGDAESGIRRLYERSLLVLQTQIDRCGGILAANDTDIMQTARAHYSYVWPRDGALVAHALDLAGHGEPAKRFFSFCAGILPHDRPFFLQKYCPDGTPGAMWHPWIADGEPEVPCQQDSTALVIWAAGEHFDRLEDREFAYTVYQDLVVPAVDYMVRELDPTTNLPRPSYDLWEQRRGVHLWTCSTVYGALSAAAKLAREFDAEKADRYAEAGERVRRGILEHMFDPGFGRFVRSLVPTAVPPRSGDPLVTHPSSNCGLQLDFTMDASMAGVFLFGVLPPNDHRVVSTMEAVYDRLWVRTPVGGLARYEDDYYFQASGDVKNVPGNPWFVTTLWLAEWYIGVAGSAHDLEPAVDLLQWTVRHTSEAGLLAEQIHPFTGQPLSVMPLTWSHAAFISAVVKYRSKALELSTHRA